MGGAVEKLSGGDTIWADLKEGGGDPCWFLGEEYSRGDERPVQERLLELKMTLTVAVWVAQGP